MVLREALEAALADAVDPVLRAAGFDGTPSTWRRRNDAGDWVVVNVEIAGTEEQAQCSLNVAVVPAPWLEFMGVWLGLQPTEVQESIGLYRARVSPSGWVVRTAADAVAVATDIARRLTEETVPVLDRLQDRAAMIRTVRAGDLGMLKLDQYPGLFDFAEAVLISEDGPSDRLDELLVIIRAQAPAARKQDVERYALWIHERAKFHGPD